MPDIAFLIVGIILTLFGIGYPILKIKHRLSCSARITARVSKVQKSHETHHRGHSYRYYTPWFTFTVNGKEYTVKSDTETRLHQKYSVGKEFVIRYNPNNPEEIAVGISLLPYLCGVLFTAFGVTFIYCYFV